MIEYLDSLDRSLMLTLNYDGGALQDQLWWIVSGKFTWIPLYLWLLWLLYKRCTPLRQHWKELTALVLLTALVVVLSDQIASGVIKHAVMRPRPSREDSGISHLLHLVNDYRGGHYGFVSSHAANTWGIALWFILLLRRWKAQGLYTHPIVMPCSLLIGWTLLNCYSRIYLGVHYPGDILGGLLVGTFVAVLVYYVLLPLANRIVKRQNP